MDRIVFKGVGNSIDNLFFNLCFLRNIILKNGVLLLYYLIAYNVLDRIGTSGLH